MTEREAVNRPSWYERIGADEGVKALADRFYAVMDSEPRYQSLRAIHPANLSRSIERFYAFLSGFLGGPPIYWQKYGHPRLRMRHGSFPIDRPMARQWVSCMQDALDHSHLDESERLELLVRFAEVADFMRNQADPVDEPDRSDP
ncbi:MAG TPA: hypothetical protein DCQ06_00780 [Myxococcales bacterium]|nr:hypothetical protein [Myxococcales bacterium]HAN30106.1 hypothetical protein [Myxococcales bacterium]